MTKWLQEEMCPFCGIPAQLLVLLEENVVWGNPHAKHGEHHFVLRNVEYYRCEDCDEEWFTSSLARSRDEKLNEEIK